MLRIWENNLQCWGIHFKFYTKLVCTDLTCWYILFYLNFDLYSWGNSHTYRMLQYWITGFLRLTQLNKLSIHIGISLYFCFTLLSTCIHDGKYTQNMMQEDRFEPFTPSHQQAQLEIVQCKFEWGFRGFKCIYWSKLVILNFDYWIYQL